jgi:2-polyprenyl-3-methyl-5-hydroxy-6-metoxy-1,4-benzoquinol methylase
MICHVCGYSQAPVVEFNTRLVSSDIAVTEDSVNFLHCPVCRTLQKAVTTTWEKQTREIYANYQDDAIMSQPIAARCKQLINLLRNVPEHGVLIDVGCGPGHFLEYFHSVRPQWKLFGVEASDRWRRKVAAIPGVEAFYANGTLPVHTGADVIVLSHILEHIPDPHAFLNNIVSRLFSDGCLLVAVPNYRQNAADLVVADHCTHFDLASFTRLVSVAGLKIDRLEVGKEIMAQLSVDKLSAFELLEITRKEAIAFKPHGIMGSSIAALWLAQELGRGIEFFIDEDKSRVSRLLNSQLVLSPEQVPAGSRVFIPMSEPVARAIIARWKHLPIEFGYTAGNRP